MAKHLLTEHLSEPLNGTSTAKVDVNIGDGNLTVDSLPSGEPVWVSGTLQYFEGQNIPSRSVSTSSGRATLTLGTKSTGRPWLHLPWQACNAGTEWRIHLNPCVQSDIMAHTGGGNVRLDLAGIEVTRVSADTGGGNMDIVLPDHALNLNVTAKTGGGNITIDVGNDVRGSNTIHASSGAGSALVRIPGGIAARIHASSGMGKVTVDSRYEKMDGNTYQSSDFDSATDKVEITVGSGAGKVSIHAK